MTKEEQEVANEIVSYLVASRVRLASPHGDLTMCRDPLDKPHRFLVQSHNPGTLVRGPVAGIYEVTLVVTRMT